MLNNFHIYLKTMYHFYFIVFIALWNKTGPATSSTDQTQIHYFSRLSQGKCSTEQILVPPNL